MWLLPPDHFPKCQDCHTEIGQMELMVELFDNEPSMGNLNRRQFKRQLYPLSLWPAGQDKYNLLSNYYLLTVLGHTGSVPIRKLHVFPLLQGMVFWRAECNPFPLAASRAPNPHKWRIMAKLQMPWKCVSVSRVYA